MITIEKFAVTTDDIVTEALFNVFKDWGQGSLLVDREIGDPLKASLNRAVDPARCWTVNPPRMPLPMDRCLLLAETTTAQLELLDQSVQLSLEQNRNPIDPVRSVGGWLFSRRASAKRISEWLQESLMVSTKDGEEFLLRAWDPRVIGHLGRILSDVQLSALFGPIDCWAWVDRSGGLQLLANPSQSVPMSSRIRLSKSQDDAVERIARLNALLRTLATLGYKVPIDGDAALDELLQTATVRGYTDETDALAYGLHAILVSRDFDSFPEVKQAIEQASQRGQGLCAALERFDDAYWADIKQLT